MNSELVERRRWISEQRFLHALNYCMLLPGPDAQKHYGPALIDDHTPTPPHARFSRARLAAVLGTGLMLWLMAMGWFFTKAAKPRPAR